jgi:Zn-dependent alcohol dehydrogenase
MSFGGKSKSSSSNTTNNEETTVTTVDNRVAEDSAAVGGNVTTGSGDINGSLSISTTDQGAIKGGVDIALESVDALSKALAGTQQAAGEQTTKAFALADNARQSETSGAINNFLKYGVWIALAGIAAYALTRKRS